MHVLELTPWTAEEHMRADWLTSYNLGLSMYPLTHHDSPSSSTTNMMLIATGSPSRLAMASEAFQNCGTFPTYSPNGGVFVS
jgi:hypothetical protein